MAEPLCSISEETVAGICLYHVHIGQAIVICHTEQAAWTIKETIERHAMGIGFDSPAAL